MVSSIKRARAISKDRNRSAQLATMRKKLAFFFCIVIALFISIVIALFVDDSQKADLLAVR